MMADSGTMEKILFGEKTKAEKELEFLRKWKADVVEEFCRYDANTIEELVITIRAKAIDEFAERLKSKSTFLKGLENEYYGFVSEMEIDEIAEELKGGSE